MYESKILGHVCLFIVITPGIVIDHDVYPGLWVGRDFLDTLIPIGFNCRGCLKTFSRKLCAFLGGAAGNIQAAFYKTLCNRIPLSEIGSDSFLIILDRGAMQEFVRPK